MSENAPIKFNRRRWKGFMNFIAKTPNEVNMNYWQLNSEKLCPAQPAWNIREFHACGNTACFGGFLALYPLFRKHSGAMGDTGYPTLWPRKSFNIRPESEFFGISDELSSLIVSGSYEHTARSKIPGLPRWEDWKKGDLLCVMQAVLNGLIPHDLTQDQVVR